MVNLPIALFSNKTQLPLIFVCLLTCSDSFFFNFHFRHYEIGGVFDDDCQAQIAANSWPTNCADFVASQPSQFVEAYWKVSIDTWRVCGRHMSL